MEKSAKEISVKNLVKDFEYHEKPEGLRGSLKALFKREKKTKHAVRDISFTVRRGEFVGFIGPNGAGKTTTLKMLSGILTPTSGQARVAGHVPWEREDRFKKKIAIVLGQKSQLWNTLPPLETYNLMRLIYDIPEKTYRRRLKRLVELLDVEDKLHVQARKLSMGQRMKCELILALLHDPQVLFLDEPTIGLDVLSQRKIRDFLTSHNKEKGTTIILTSHNMDDVEDLCRRLVIIDEGVIGYDGTLEKIKSDYGEYRYLSARFGDKVSRDALAKIGEVLEYSGIEARLRVPTGDTPSRVNKLTSQFDVKDIGLQDVDLEEIVSDIFSKSKQK